jgi:hypothetical protein
MGDMADFILDSYECDNWIEEDGGPSNYWHTKKPHDIIRFNRLEYILDCKVPFGKYKGQTVSAIARVDFGYILWLGTIKPRGLLKDVVFDWIAAYEYAELKKRAETMWNLYNEFMWIPDSYVALIRK